MFSAYSVAVKISLVNQVSATLAAMTAQMNGFNQATQRGQRSLGGLNQQAVALRANLNAIRALGIGGGALAMAGGGVLSLFKAPLEAAKQFDLARARFDTLGLGDAVNREAESFARGAQVFGVSSTQMMDTMREMASFFGSMDTARMIAPKIASLNVANSTLFGGKIGKIDEGSARSIMRFADMIGMTNDPQSLMKALDIAQRAVTSSGGAMKFSDMEAVAKYGGVSAKAMSGDGWYNMFSVMQEMGGARTGTAMQSMYSNLISGRTTKQAMAEMVSMGLGSIEQEKVGTVGGKDQTRNLFRLRPEIRSAMSEDSFGGFQKFILPAIEKKYGSDQSKVLEAVNLILTNRTGANLGANFATQFVQIMRDAKLGKGAMGVDDTIARYGKTGAAAQVEMMAKWNRLLTELGLTILPMAIKGVEGLNKLLAAGVQFAQSFPTLTKGILATTAALGGLALGGGMLMLTAAGFRAIGTAIGLAGATGAGGGMLAALAGLAGPLAIATAALITLAAAAYAFSPISRGEAARAGGQRALLTPEAAARAKALGWDDPFDTARGTPFAFGPKNTFLTGKRVAGATAAMGIGAPPAGANQTTIVGSIQMDGRKVGEIVTGHQAGEFRRPPAGGTRFDPSMSPMSPSYSLSGAL